ncbi:MAG: dethiobiotin synthase [Acidobacteriota bacterium]|nr:dethiobiotin synthase [Blastocatellia bacterium]MDW8413625.1 dethiobiotin synthase [Acidobacteriota bacterium]
MRGLFITGTDTNVGKTYVSAAIIARYDNVTYWKPIQTGIESDDDTKQVALLAEAEGRVIDVGFRLPLPLSPHLSARLAGVTIELKEVLSLVSFKGDSALVVEGAGGLLVPINEREKIADLIVALKLPVVIVARTTLGTINHTLLTLEACLRRSIEVACVVMSGRPNKDNKEAIEEYGKVKVLELPYFESGNFSLWARQVFDSESFLERYL